MSPQNGSMSDNACYRQSSQAIHTYIKSGRCQLAVFVAIFVSDARQVEAENESSDGD